MQQKVINCPVHETWSPARDGIPSLHSDGEALPEVACLSCVTSSGRDTPAELGDKLLALNPPGS